MFGLGTTEIVIILVIIVVLFGGRRIPELGRGLAEGIKNFKKGIKDSSSEDEDARNAAAPPSKDKPNT